MEATQTQVAVLPEQPVRRFLSAEEIIGAAIAPRFEEVEIKGAGWVRVASMTMEARDAFEDMVNVEAEDAEGNTVRKFTRRGFRAKLLAATIINEDGSLVFTEGDTDALLRARAEVMEPVVAVALRLNGFSKADEDALVKG